MGAKKTAGRDPAATGAQSTLTDLSLCVCRHPLGEHAPAGGCAHGIREPGGWCRCVAFRAAPAPRERPILFKGRLVRAILEGRKTQTRQVITTEGAQSPGIAYWRPADLPENKWRWVACDGLPMGHIACPFGAPGDRLWVRENFALEVQVDGDQPLPWNDVRPVHRDSIGWTQAHYQATDPKPELECQHRSHEGDPCPHPWKPSIHMPRWASRIDLEVTEVRVQRLQDISEEDVIAEGSVDRYSLEAVRAGECTARECFKPLWDSINAARGFGWDANPWVWAITFRRLRP